MISYKLLLIITLIITNPSNIQSKNYTKMNIIFDLDGTLADTTDFVFYECWNQIAERNGYPVMTNEDISLFKKVGLLSFMKHMNISTFKIPFLAKQVFNEMNKNIDKIKPIKGIIEAIKIFKQRGYTLGIVTSNSKDNAERFLKKSGVLDQFDFIYSEESIFNKFKALFSKGKIIQACMEKYNLTPNKTFYVGDEVRDIDAAKYASIKVISVTWGFNNKELLTLHNPDYLVENTTQLIDIFTQVQ